MTKKFNILGQSVPECTLTRAPERDTHEALVDLFINKTFLPLSKKAQKKTVRQLAWEIRNEDLNKARIISYVSYRIGKIIEVSSDPELSDNPSFGFWIAGRIAGITSQLALNEGLQLNHDEIIKASMPLIYQLCQSSEVQVIESCLGLRDQRINETNIRNFRLENTGKNWQLKPSHSAQKILDEFLPNTSLKKLNRNNDCPIQRVHKGFWSILKTILEASDKLEKKLNK